MPRKFIILGMLALFACTAVAYAQDEPETAEMEAMDDSMDLDNEAEAAWDVEVEVPEMSEEEAEAAVGDAADGETLSADWYARVKALKNKTKASAEADEVEMGDYHALSNWNKTAAVTTLINKFNLSKTALPNKTALLAASTAMLPNKTALVAGKVAALNKTAAAALAAVPAKNMTATLAAKAAAINSTKAALIAAVPAKTWTKPLETPAATPAAAV